MKNVAYVKRLALFVVLLLIFNYTSKAQVTAELLQSKEWTMSQGSKFVKITIKFTKEEIQKSITAGGDTSIEKGKYYLSDIADKTFDASKVGKANNGNFIIVEDPTSPDKMEIMEVLKIEMPVMEVKNILQGGAILKLQAN